MKLPVKLRKCAKNCNPLQLSLKICDSTLATQKLATTFLHNWDVSKKLPGQPSKFFFEVVSHSSAQNMTVWNLVVH